MNNAWNLPSCFARIVAFCTEIMKATTRRSVADRSYVVHASNDAQKWRGLFCGPLVLRVFAAHLSAIEGSVRVPNLHGEHSTKSTKPINAVGALGMAAASVCALCHAHGIFLIIDRWSGL